MLLYKHQTIKSEHYDEEKGIVSGYGSVFGNPDSDGDIMDRGAYRKTLMENKERMKFLWQHDMREPIGKFLEMDEDEYGLKFAAQISNTQKGQDAKLLIKDGVINEFSVGFMPIKMSEGDDGYNHIKEVKLFEISLVTLAANDKAIMTDYKSEIKSDDIIEKLDSMIKLNNSIKSEEARLIMEYELRKYRGLLESYIESQKALQEESQVKQHLEALDTFNKLIEEF